MWTNAVSAVAAWPVWVRGVAAVAGVAVVVGGAFGIAAAAQTDPGSEAAPSTPSSTPTPSAIATATPSPRDEFGASATPSPSATPTTSATAPAAPTQENDEGDGDAAPDGHDARADQAWTAGLPLPGIAGVRTAVVLDKPADDARFARPVFDPHRGEYVAIVYGGMVPSELYVGRASEPLTRVPSVADYEMAVSWSPDGQSVAYLGEDGDRVTVSTVRADGSGAKRLATLREVDSDGCCVLGATLSWSGDGSTIAVSYGYTSDELSAATTALVDAATGSATYLEGAGSAAFAPQGWRLALYRTAGDGVDFVLRGREGTETALSTAAAPFGNWVTGHARWAPGADAVAYRAVSGFDSEVEEWRLVDAQGRDDVPVRTASGGSDLRWGLRDGLVAFVDDGLWVGPADALDGAPVIADAGSVSWLSETTVGFIWDGVTAAYSVAEDDLAFGNTFVNHGQFVGSALSREGLVAEAHWSDDQPTHVLHVGAGD